MKNGKLELRRQGFHLGLGLLTVFGLKTGVLTDIMLFYILIVGLALSMISKRVRVPVIAWFLDIFGREEELKTFPGKGSAFFVIGTLLAVRLFPLDVAVASILILTVGDSVSHVVGMYFGKTNNPLTSGKKLLEGNVAGAIAAIIALIILKLIYPHFGVTLAEICVASIGAMIVEAVEIDLNKQPVDDNIVLPLAAGGIITFMRYLF